MNSAGGPGSVPAAARIAMAILVELFDGSGTDVDWSPKLAKEWLGALINLDLDAGAGRAWSCA